MVVAKQTQDMWNIHTTEKVHVLSIRKCRKDMRAAKRKQRPHQVLAVKGVTGAPSVMWREGSAGRRYNLQMFEKSTH